MRYRLSKQKRNHWFGRGAAERPADPFVFRWKVNVAGYEWLDGVDGKLRLYPISEPGIGIRSYAPEPGTFREFAALNPTREGILDFAKKYGDLFDSWDSSHAPLEGNRTIGGTALDRWKIKIADMRNLLTIWEQIQDKQLVELKKIIVHNGKEVCYVRGRTNITLAREDNRPDVLLYARCALQLEVNKRLSDTETPTLVVPRVTWTEDYHQQLVFEPSNLLAAMWLEFAQATIGAFRLQQCAACHNFFQVGPGAKRGHSDVCGATCRQRKKRARDAKNRAAKKSI